MKKYYMYQIKNKINNKIYIGVHQTNKLRDTYMGSGVEIKKAIKLEGIDNFEKTILEYFKSADEMYFKEKEIVNEDFIKREDTYNVIIGGRDFNTIGTVVVKDKDGNIFRVNKYHPKYLNNELVSIMKNKLNVKCINGKIINVDKNDPRYLSGEFSSIHLGKIVVKDSMGNKIEIDKNDPRYLSGELVPQHLGKVTVKDSNGNKFMVDKNDPRYLSGELRGHIIGTIKAKDINGKAYKIYPNDPRILTGELIIRTKEDKRLAKNIRTKKRRLIKKNNERK